MAPHSILMNLTKASCSWPRGIGVALLLESRSRVIELVNATTFILTNVLKASWTAADGQDLFVRVPASSLLAAASKQALTSARAAWTCPARAWTWGFVS